MKKHFPGLAAIALLAGLAGCKNAATGTAACLVSHDPGQFSAASVRISDTLIEAQTPVRGGIVTVEIKRHGGFSRLIEQFGGETVIKAPERMSQKEWSGVQAVKRCAAMNGVAINE